ncbi:2-amino-4-hydroxy-6-hydroxymethyldihydropteridine diphosphokinase [Galbibacter mesophilus]|uniref:2-amino-4-hydroxy-6- hydroxymethyldihydropteridine diphosphokinase n=1 Tax=Galbibacter mesophilus TaxID=379069 RepID=UPI00191EAD20|nr:2-amino-4-hydroxy-6-hydroxymethyldihydropteridine diphosphokinase [Galbibacter mesophilus]MCM5664260.1 2-amino-4-hydroxy-6-hydroxymethyldihydropteridine diphosphokinase [Galbibacter mesophilus]
MIHYKRTYLSVGSNLGDKYENLSKTVRELREKAGNVVSCSPIYQTPAWGFEGDDFYNICVGVDTELQPQELLDCLLQIEKSLGRIRSKNEGYAARTVDLDILFYEDEVLDEPDLVIPHPHLQNRLFVLQPLADIAPGKVHPIFEKSIIELLDVCEDESELEKLSTSISLLKKDFSKFNFIAIEGNIGAGKTTLANKIAEDFNGKLVLERFADNPFLPKFYEDRNRYAFPLEMSFLADRYQQFTDDTSRPDLFKNFMVSDYDIFKSLIFAKVTLQEDEFSLYRKVFNFMYKEVVKPDVYVYLYQNTERLLQNIKKRGRSYEQKIPADYLEKLNEGYLDFIKTHPEVHPLVIDISDLDFVQNHNDYQFIIDKIHDF